MNGAKSRPQAPGEGQGQSAVVRYLRERARMAAGDRFLLGLVGLGIAGALLILLRQVNYGIGLDGDSLAYLSAARSLAAGKGLVTAGGWPVTLLWPPLFPLLIGLPGFLGLDAAAAASLLNAGAFGVLVGAVGWGARRRSGSTALGLWAALAVMLAIPVSERAYQAMSEAVFILLATLALMQGERFLDGGKRGALIGAAVLAALACLTRYNGVAVVITMALLPLLNSGSVRERAKSAAQYILIALTPLAVVMLGSRIFSGAFSGRLAEPRELPQNLRQAAETLASWLLPGAWSDDNMVAAALLSALALGVAVGAVVLAVGLRRGQKRLDWALMMPGAFTLIYIVFLVAMGNVTQLSVLNNRYLSPAYVPLALSAAGLAGWWLRAGPARAGLRRAPLVILFIWLAYPLAATAMDINRTLTEGTGRYSNARWVNSDLVGYINQHLSGVEYGGLYSNNEHITYFHGGIPARLLPINRSDLHQVYQNQAGAAGVYVVWFEDVVARRRDYGQGELAAALPYPQRLFEDGDGALYYVGPESVARGIRDGVAEMGAPAVSDFYEVYIGDDRLAYVRESCGAGDTAARFYLHIVPEARADLPVERRGYGFANRDFDFERFGLRSGGSCLISVPLPEWELTAIRTGQYTDAGRLWEGEFAVGAQ